MVSHDSSKDNNDDKQWKQSSSLFLRRVAGALGASGVALGAIGAHAFKETLTKRGTGAIWQTATIYHLFHATAILALGNVVTSGRNSLPSSIRVRGEAAANNNNNNNTIKPRRSTSNSITDKLTLLLAGKLLAVGTVMFSGSIYCLALNVGPKAFLGPTTPLGGLIMIGGWIVVGLSPDVQ